MNDLQMDAWQHKDEWKRNGAGFCVVVSRHSVTVGPGDITGGPHRWCVYAYVYPKHPHFANFSGSQMWQDAATCMPLHCYPSLLRWHRGDDGVALSVQVGADYDHIHDDHYAYYADADAARSVFNDAQELFDWLDERKQERKVA